MESEIRNIGPLVSIIVTTYNRELQLLEAINSIIEQTYQNIEILVVDNFSDYDIQGLIQSFNDPRIVLVQNENGGNYVVNRNLGILKSTGEYIAFCDDDDYWLPHKLSEQMRFFTQSPYNATLGLVYSRCYMLGPAGIYRVGPRAPLYNGHVFFKMLIIPSVPILTALVKKTVFDDIGMFNEDPVVRCQEDNEFWIRLSKNYSVKSFSEPTAVYREHVENLSNTHKITLSARFYLHKDMLKNDIFPPFLWIFYVVPGLFLVLSLQALLSHVRKVIESGSKVRKLLKIR